jgi:hypothetical protein
MEPNNKFNLAAATEKWLHALSKDAVMTEGDVSELRDHIHSHIEQHKDTDPELAFSQAIAALGDVNSLRTEYAKANQRWSILKSLLAVSGGLAGS